MLAEILRRIGVAGGGFVEFGIQDGTEGNTVFLAQVLGWRGAYLEADDAQLRRARAPLRRQPARAHACTPRSSRTRSRRCSRDAGVPPEPDVVSIDVDGNDYWIWQALDAYRPRSW